MKRISILSALLLMCAMTFAQQALWGGAPVVSPEIHDNNTVTFRLKAPKAVKVQVTGDFLPTQKIKTPFGEFDGPGVADLKENKDGVWEFTTPEPLKPELYSYTFLVDGLKINDPSNVYMIRDVASVTNVFIIGGDERIDLYKVNKVPHGTVSKVWYNSPTLGMDRRLTVYTPAGYLPKTMEGSFETAFPDVVKFIDKTYRTQANKKGRAIAGLSMGGFHSMHISKQYPDMFDYVGLFSAAIMPNKDVKSPIYDNLEAKLKTQFAKKPSLYYIAIGNKDFLFQANNDYRKMLDEKGYKYEYYETGEGHIWKNWRIYLTEFAPKIFK